MTMMMSDPGLLSAVETSIDALCFYSTHVVDTDFRAHAKTALDTIHSLQSEQKQRIDATYGGAALTPDQVAEQLDELYHADAQSVPTSSTSNSTNQQPQPPHNVVDAMSPVTARIFKREMKVRIHEWEASFRSLYGREATPLDKASLRGIYELYKTVKLRVQQDDEARKSGGGGGGVPPGQSGQSQQQLQSGVSASTSIPNNNAGGGQSMPMQSAGDSMGAGGGKRPTPHRPTSPPNTRAVPPPPPPQPPAHPRPLSPKVADISAALPIAGALAPSHGGVASFSNNNPTTTSGANQVITSAPPAPGTTATTATSAVLSGSGVDYNQPAAANNSTSSAASLVAEKKNLKRRLHQFEDEFKRQHGRVPSKEDRRLVGKDYHRYGELKALLAHQGGGGD